MSLRPHLDLLRRLAATHAVEMRNSLALATRQLGIENPLVGRISEELRSAEEAVRALTEFETDPPPDDGDTSYLLKPQWNPDERSAA